MSNSKPWYESWLIVLGIVQALGGSGGAIYEFLKTGDFSLPAISLAVAGVAAVILRVISSGKQITW